VQEIYETEDKSIMDAPQENLQEIPLPELGNFSTEAECYRLFPFMKAAKTLESLYSRIIPLDRQTGSRFSGFRLVPVSKIHSEDASLIEDLVDWRINARFHGDGAIDVDGTKIWLAQSVLNRNDRILFLVVDEHGFRHGHLGLWMRDSKTLELDNVIKNPGSDVKGVMSSAAQSIGRWAHEFLGAQSLSLRVASDNFHAIHFYSELGYQELRRLPLEPDPEDLRHESRRNAVEWVVMSADTEIWLEQKNKILTAGPSIGALEQALVGDAVRSGWNDHHSDYLTAFSDDFSAYIASKHSIPTDSCTSALHLALWALGIGPGDEVIVPEVTWVATASAVRYVGATPVFADIDEHTWCISPESITSLITQRTRAVIPVHLYGFVADIEKISEICQKYDLYMIQDAAPGIGSLFNGGSVAEFGDFTCFSFQGAKLLVTGEGGMLTTNNTELFQKATKIADHGRLPGTFWIEELGKKIKMNNHSAALGLAQLYSVERQIERKTRIANQYRDELSGVSDISFQEEAPGTRSIHWMTSICVRRDGFNREVFRNSLLAKGIDTRPLFSPISRYPIWGELSSRQTVASAVGDNGINLPSGVGLTSSEVSRVASAVRELLE